MNAETAPGAYPGNPSLPREVKEKILSTFRHTLNLFHEGKLDDCIIGCDFILKMDARFAPGRSGPPSRPGRRELQRARLRRRDHRRAERPRGPARKPGRP